MDDYGHAQADREIEKLERRYKKVYGEAARGVREKAEAFFDGFARRDQEQRALVDAGKLSARDYRNWRINQMAIGKRWTDFADTITDELAHANEIATSLVNKRLPGVYALNHNYAAYTIEQGAGMGLNFELYDRRTVERLMKGDPRLLPVKQLDVPKDKRWNTKKIQTAVLQGIIQGEDIGKIADRFQAVTDANRDAALRNVRTCVTGAENAGRLDGFKSAERMGIGMKKEWLATLDDRTRASHRLLDGQRVETDKKFSNGLMYPGDPFGPASEVYNCRCTMIAAIDGVQEVEPVYRRDNLDGERIADMSYQDWHKMKLAQAAAQPVQAAAQVVQVSASETVAQAAEYAKNTLGVQKVYYGKLDVTVADEINAAVSDGIQYAPQIKQNMQFVGSTQERNRILRKELAAAADADLRVAYPNETEAWYARQSKAIVGKFVKNVGQYNYATAFNRVSCPAYPTIESVYNRFVGIGVNERFGADGAMFLRGLAGDVASGFHPVGTGTIRAVFDHEIGHQLDYAFGLRSNAEMRALFSGYKRAEIAKGLSTYGSKSIAEFIAEGYSEYKNNPKPREIATKIGEIVEKAAKGAKTP